jgi:hypothetical protein
VDVTLRSAAARRSTVGRGRCGVVPTLHISRNLWLRSDGVSGIGLAGVRLTSNGRVPEASDRVPPVLRGAFQRLAGCWSGLLLRVVAEAFVGTDSALGRDDFQHCVRDRGWTVPLRQGEEQSRSRLLRPRWRDVGKRPDRLGAEVSMRRKSVSLGTRLGRLVGPSRHLRFCPGSGRAVRLCKRVRARVREPRVLARIQLTDGLSSDQSSSRDGAGGLFRIGTN